MRFLLAVLFLPAVMPGRAEIRDVVKSADIDRMFPRAAGRFALHERPNFSLWLVTAEGKPGPSETDGDFDQVLFVRRGPARLTLGAPPRHHDIAAGDVVNIPRGTPHQLDPGSGQIRYIQVRIVPGSGAARPGIRPAPRQMGDVLSKSEIDSTFARFDRNQPIHSAPNFTMNYVIYPAHAGPWEAHQGCIDIYFLQIGTATAQLGGKIVDAKQESPGEPRGTAVTGARTHAIGPGDIVLIPRSTVHHMDPGPGKLGYILMKVWAD